MIEVKLLIPNSKDLFVLTVSTEGVLTNQDIIGILEDIITKCRGANAIINNATDSQLGDGDLVRDANETGD